ncbi:MAG: PKD domain-containing protein [Bacteroidetes bacterium]|nr:PKD domain-containing protein [Bacteroidota bacterium]
MFHRFLLYLTCTSLLLGVNSRSLNAQPCADTQPVIAGAQVVVNNQLGVIYSTPNIPGHTYLWNIVGGAITSGGNSSMVTVNWGPVGAGSLSVTETNPSIPCFSTVSKNIKIQPLLISYFYYTNTSCYGDMLSYWDNSVNDAAKPIVNYFIDFGDGTAPYNSPVKPNPVLHTYGAPYNITYTITYVVTNNEGATDTIYDAVYVNPNQFIPTAAFNSTIPNCSYQPVSFDGSISTTPFLTTPFERYSWDFGDPASGAANFDSCKTCSKPTHLFTGPGTYNVTLSVLNHTSCTNSITQQIVIAQSVPTASYTFSAPTCENNPVFFTDNSTFPAGKDIVSWQWYFGDLSAPVIINTPASPNVSHTFPALGPYTVELRVTNNLGCIDSAYHSVTLTPSPIADFTYGVPCAGDTMHFQNHSKLNNGPAIVSYSWDFGDAASGNNTSNQVDGTHIYANAGTYTVTLAIANLTGCPDTVRKTITINPRPAVEYSWNVGAINNQIAFHVDSTITDLGLVGYMCHWNFGDGTYGVGHNPVHTYLGSNNWIATLTVTDTMGCSNSISHTIYVPEIPMAFYSSNAPVCLNTPMCFTDLSSVPSPPFGFITTWVWNYGDLSPQDTIHFPNNPNTCHTYAVPGTYLVSLTVTDNSGFTDTYSHNQTVLPLPIANFFNTTGCEGKLVQFTDASFPNGGGNIISWDWLFDDPLSGIDNTSNLQDPTHIFNTGGVTYNVRLIIHNFDDCVDTIVKPVYIFPSPPVDFTRDTACLGDLVHFFANTTITHVDSIVTWSWDFGDGTPPSTDPINTSHLYTAPGIYVCTLTVIDHHGCVNTVSHQVKVNPKPIPEFSWSVPACTDSPILYTDQSTVPAGYTGYIAKWMWDFDDGTTQTITIPASPNVTHTFATGSLTHLVRLTVWTSDSCTLFKEHLINSIPSPIANFDYSTISCKGQPVQFNDLSQVNGGGGITIWNWNFGDPGSGFNNLSTLQSPAHTFAVAGSYTVTLIIQNSTGCHDTIVKTVTVNMLPVSDFHADTACLNSVTQFTDLSVPNAANIITYSWNFGDGSPLSSMQNPTHTYSTYGVFNVKLTIVNSNGCTKDTTKQILVNPLPIPEFSFTSPNCLGAVVCYTDLSHTVSGYLGSIVKWVWDFNDGTTQTVLFPASPNVCHTFAGSVLSHNVRLTITTSDSCTAFIDHVVNSIPSPIANFSFPGTTCTSQSVQFSDLSQNNGGGAIISWDWNFGDPPTGVDNTSNAQNPVHFFSGPGTFTVSLIVKNTSGCQDTILKTVIVSPLPVANFTADTACLGSLTTFTNSSLPNSTNIISYNWDFGDGSPNSPLQNPTHTYGTYGIKNVKLTVVNSNGCVKDTTKQVLVHPLPLPAFSYTTPNCMGASVQFTDQSTTVAGYLGSIVEWVWDFGDGGSTTIWFPGNPSVTHTFSGGALQHTVRLTVKTSDSCTAFIEHVVNSMAAPLASFSFPTSNCAHQSVQFTDLSQANGGGNIIQWHWDFGDPGSGVPNNSTSQNPTHIFSTSGVFTVTEIVYNASACSDTTTRTVTVIPLPVANFRADTVCLGSLTSFFDQSTATGTITQRYWEFGDGQFSNSTNPTHMYATSGVFIVRLTVTTAEGCIKDTTKSVLVIPKPAASFTTDAPACSSDTVHFTDLSTTPHGTIVTWKWDFGDGNSSTINFPASPNVSHYYTAGGTYTVVLTITTSDNCTDQISTPVQIQASPLANFTYATTRCALMPVQFTDLSQTGGGSTVTQWLWNFGDPTSGSANTSTIKNATHSFTHSGTFSVNLMVTSATGCTDSISKTVSINASPQAKFVADTACVGGNTQFTDQSVANSTSISSWEWNFGDPASGTNNVSSLQNPIHTYGSPGLYSVMLTVTNSNSCVHDTVIQVAVNPKPQAMFSASVSCVGDSTAFTDLSIAPGSGISAWFWDFGDGGTATIQNPKHMYMTASTFNVKLRVTNLSNCSDSILIPVTTRPKPVASFAYTSFFCPAGQVVFQDQSTGTGAAIVQREWTFMPGSTSSLINPTFVFPVTDMKYLVSLVVTDSYGCSDTISDSVYVKPGFAFTFKNDTVCFKNPTHFTAVDLAKGDSLYNIVWNFGDPNSGPNNTSYQFAPTHTFSQPGTFVVKLRVTDSDNCTDSIFHEVTVHALPSPVFTVLSQPCDSVIRFTETSGPGSGTISSWEWTFGDGSPPLIIPGSVGSGDTSHIYLAQNIYPVVLKVTNSFGCYDTIMQTAELYPCILASFSHSDTLMCARYNIAFKDSSLPVSIINQWKWIFGDGTDTTYFTHAGIIHHTFANAGTYNVKLIIHAMISSGRTFVDTNMQSVVIHATPLAAFSNLSVCRKQFTAFQDTSNTFGTPNSTWKWIFGESYSGSKDTSYFKNPSHKYDSAGVYDVKMVVMNKFGCKDSITKPTRVYEIPTARFNNTIACSGNPTDFTDKTLIADTANIASWLWNFGEPTSHKDTSQIQDPSHEYKKEGDYLVTLIVKDQHGCYDTADSTIAVHVTPVSSFTYTENVSNMTGKLQFQNQSTGADSWVWDFGNGQTSTDENPVVTYADDGSFIIMLVSNNAFKCTDTTWYKYEFRFKGLYIPNAFAPTSLSQGGASTFSPVGVNLKQYKIEVFDNWGHLVWSSTHLTADGRPDESWLGRDTAGNPYPSGTYMWKAKATFIDNTEWEGSDIGKGEYKTFGTVTLIR